MRHVIGIGMLVLMASLNLFGQAEAEYRKTLEEMFEVSGTEESYKVAITQMVGMMKQQYPNVDAAIWEEFEKEFLNTSLNDLVEMLVPVYSKHMTQADLKNVIAFYQTPTGKKYADKTPLIMQESMQVGQEWGVKLGEDFVKKMKDKGY